MENEPDAQWQYKGQAQEAYDGESMNASEASPAPEVTPVSWTASEYISHEKSASWYFALMGGSLLIVLLVFLVTRDVFTSIVVLVACGLLAYYAGRQPETKQYEVNSRGVKVGDKIYAYSDFRSFSIVEEGAIESIWLKPLKRMSPVVIMYFAPQEADSIIEVLAQFLPHEERQLDAIDRFSKSIRF